MNKICSMMILVVSLCACGVNPAERNNAGNALYDQGQYDSAIAAYQAAQVASPDNPEAYYNAASAYGQKGEYDKAIGALQQALKTADSVLKGRTYYNLGNIYFQMYRFDDAVEAYREALLINPNDEDARHNLELAIRRLVVPSPTPISPTDQASDGGNGSATPTAPLSPQASAVDAATPDLATPQSDSLTSSLNANDLPATISVDDALDILDAVQQAQQSLPGQYVSGTPSSVNSGKDW